MRNQTITRYFDLKLDIVRKPNLSFRRLSIKDVIAQASKRTFAIGHFVEFWGSVYPQICVWRLQTAILSIFYIRFTLIPDSNMKKLEGLNEVFCKIYRPANGVPPTKM